jgi:polyisoprenoid-binding protein YceI
MNIRMLLSSLLISATALLLVPPAARGENASAVPVQAGAATLDAQNTKLQFVCAHVGPKPDPRTGSFGKLTGKAQLDAGAKSLKSVVIEIDTNSLTTEFDKLTTHLKSPDFFEVRRFPTAKFESTKIEPGSGSSQITGKLTLHGVTKEVTIPAKVEVTPTGLHLTSEFTINRSDYGMTYDPKKVEDKVTLTVAIGQ